MKPERLQAQASISAPAPDSETSEAQSPHEAAKALHIVPAVRRQLHHQLQEPGKIPDFDRDLPLAA